MGKENKLKNDPAPEVGGGDSGRFEWIVFPVKKFIRENILNSDPAPEVGGSGQILVILNCFSPVKNIIRENILKSDPAPEIGGQILDRF